MAQARKDYTRKYVVFKNNILDFAEREAEDLGLSFAEYLRFLVAQRKLVVNKRGVTETVSPGEANDFLQSTKEIESGVFETVNDEEEIEKAFSFS